MERFCLFIEERSVGKYMGKSAKNSPGNSGKMKAELHVNPDGVVFGRGCCVPRGAAGVHLGHCSAGCPKPAAQGGPDGGASWRGGGPHHDSCYDRRRPRGSGDTWTSCTGRHERAKATRHGQDQNATINRRIKRGGKWGLVYSHGRHSTPYNVLQVGPYILYNSLYRGSLEV